VIICIPGEKGVFDDGEVSVPTSLSLNGRIFISRKDHLDALVSNFLNGDSSLFILLVS